jgi:hypothetical protein
MASLQKDSVLDTSMVGRDAGECNEVLGDMGAAAYRVNMRRIRVRWLHFGAAGFGGGSQSA